MHLDKFDEAYASLIRAQGWLAQAHGALDHFNEEISTLLLEVREKKRQHEEELRALADNELHRYLSELIDKDHQDAADTVPSTGNGSSSSRLNLLEISIIHIREKMIFLNIIFSK